MRHANPETPTRLGGFVLLILVILSAWISLIAGALILFAVWCAYDWYARSPIGTHPVITVLAMVGAVGLAVREGRVRE